MERPEMLRPRLWVAALGVLGLIGLLLVAQAIPSIATPLRDAALVWFFGVGAYETLWRVGSRRAR